MSSLSCLLLRTAFGAETGALAPLPPLLDGPGVAEAPPLRTEPVLVGGFGFVEAAAGAGVPAVEAAGVAAGVSEGGPMVICATGAPPIEGVAAGVAAPDSVDCITGASCIVASDEVVAAAASARVVPAAPPLAPRPLPLPLPRPGAAGALGGILCTAADGI